MFPVLIALIPNRSEHAVEAGTRKECYGRLPPSVRERCGEKQQ